MQDKSIFQKYDFCIWKLWNWPGEIGCYQTMIKLWSSYRCPGTLFQLHPRLPDCHGSLGRAYIATRPLRDVLLHPPITHRIAHSLLPPYLSVRFCHNDSVIKIFAIIISNTIKLIWYPAGAQYGKKYNSMVKTQWEYGTTLEFWKWLCRRGLFLPASTSQAFRCPKTIAFLI